MAEQSRRRCTSKVTQRVGDDAFATRDDHYCRADDVGQGWSTVSHVQI